MLTRKKQFASISACILLAGSLTAQAVDSSTAQTWVHPIYVNGQHADYTAADGTLLQPLMFQDSIYIPLRAVGDWMGKNVSWDTASRTITMSGTVPQKVSFSNAGGNTARTTPVQVCPDISVVLDGSKKIFRSASGEVIYPLICDDYSYLPLRAVGELTGYQVRWEEQGSARLIYLSDQTTKEQLQAARQYIADVKKECEVLAQNGALLIKETDRSKLLSELKNIENASANLRALTFPADGPLTGYQEEFQQAYRHLEDVCPQVRKIAESGASVAACQDVIWGTTSDMFPHEMILQGHFVAKIADAAETYLTQLS